MVESVPNLSKCVFSVRHARHKSLHREVCTIENVYRLARNWALLNSLLKGFRVFDVL